MIDIKTLLSFLFIFLILFHAIIYLGWTNKRFWIRIDYLWVSLSFLGIIGIIRDVQKQSFNTRLADIKINVETQYGYAYNLTKRNLHFLEPNPFEFFRDSIEEKQVKKKLDEKSIVLRFWYNNLERKLDDEKIKILRLYDSSAMQILKLHSDNFPIPKDWFPEATRDYYDIKSIIDDINSQVSLVNNLKENEKTYAQWEFILKFISPWLLAFAIALRLSKVTAQLKGIA